MTPLLYVIGGCVKSAFSVFSDAVFRVDLTSPKSEAKLNFLVLFCRAIAVGSGWLRQSQGPPESRRAIFGRYLCSINSARSHWSDRVKVLLYKTSGLEPPRTIVLGNKPLQIGRDPAADIPVSELQISRRHCEFQKVGGKLLIWDLNSRNGTFVNFIRITERFLAPGDTLVIGRTEFRVEFEVEPTAAVASCGWGRHKGEAAPSLPLPSQPDADATTVQDMGDTVRLPDDAIVTGSAHNPQRRTAERDLPHAAIPPPMSAGTSAGRPGPSQGLPREAGATAIGTASKSPPVATDPLLDELVAAWPRLPPVLRSKIIAAVRATLPKG